MFPHSGACSCARSVIVNIVDHLKKAIKRLTDELICLSDADAGMLARAASTRHNFITVTGAS